MAWARRNKRIFLAAVAAIAVGISTFAIWSCTRGRLSISDFKVPSLSAEERTRLGLPQEGKLVLATPADVAYVKSVGDDVLSVLSEFFGPKTAKWQIVAARPVGDCLLLWVGFPGIADGGIDLIYSKKVNGIIGGFSGGIYG